MAEWSRSAVPGVRSCPVQGVMGFSIGFTSGPRIEGDTEVKGWDAPIDFDAPGKALWCCAASWPEGWEDLLKATVCEAPEVGGGGSAMPWGLVLPAARAKLVEGESEPVVMPAALSNW